MKRTALVVTLLLASSAAFALEPDPAYRYGGTHAGGPANALIPVGKPKPVAKRKVDKAYRYGGTHAGGPADLLIPEGKPQRVVKVKRNKAYMYGGTHAGGPADELIPR